MEEALSEVDFQLKVDLHFTDSEQQWVSLESLNHDNTVAFAQHFSSPEVPWWPWTSEHPFEARFLISYRNEGKEYLRGHLELHAF